jgi:beta-glucosidase
VRYLEATVRNTGDRAGAEVMQVYLSVPSGSGLPQPPKRLVGFRKVVLEPGASERIAIDLDPDASHHPVSVWDGALATWPELPAFLRDPCIARKRQGEEISRLRRVH